MKQKCKFVALISSMLVVLVACASSDNLIATEYKVLEYPKSTLIHTETFSTSGATGKCTGQANDWWYGTSEESNRLIDDFEKQLSENGWVTWPEDVTQIWRKENDNGLFTFSLFVFTNTEQIDPNRAYYNLSDSVLLDMNEHKTAYVITLSHMFSDDANRCLRP